MKTTWPLQQPTGKWKIFIFSVLSHISLQNWRAWHVSPGGQESAKRENGGARVCEKVCITSVNTLPCRIKTTSVAEGKKETMVSRITHTLKKKPDGGFTSDYFVETKYSHARNQWIIFVLTSCFADKGNNPSCCHLRFAPLFSSMYIVSHLIDWGILFYMEYVCTNTHCCCKKPYFHSGTEFFDPLFSELTVCYLRICLMRARSTLVRNSG